MKYFMGIDIGTSGSRIGVFDEFGNQVGEDKQSWDTVYLKPGWAEQNPNTWWNCVEKSLAILSKTLSDDIKQNIVTATVDATASTSFPIDKEVRPLANALMWMDMRAVKETEEINKTHHEVFKYCGGDESAEWFTPKLLWQKRHDSETYKAAYKYIEQLDWINYKLSGVLCSNMCVAVCKYHYVSDLGGYCMDFFEQVGLEDWNDKVLQNIELIGADLGVVKPEITERFGFNKDMKLIQGGVDAHIGMFGNNAFTPGKVSINMGTSFCILANIDYDTTLEGFWGPYKDAVCDGMWCIEGGQASAAGLTNWFVENFNIPKENCFKNLEATLKETEPGADGLIVCDNFQGNRSPYKDPFAKGIIYGLTLKHSWKYIYRAVLEGIAYGTNNVLDHFKHAFEIDRIIACGGASKNEAWLQMISDISGKTIVTNECGQGCILGCCVVGAAVYMYDGDFEKAANALVHEADIYEPNMKMHKIYQPLYQKYIKLYESTKELNHL